MESESSSVLSMQPPAPVAEVVLNIVEAVLGRKVPDEHTNLVGFGASSMELIRIINRLEDETGFRPDFQQVSVAPTIAALTAAVNEWGAMSGDQNLAPRAADRGDHAAAPGFAAATSDRGRQFLLDGGPPDSAERPRSVRDFSAVPVARQQLSHLLDGLRIDEENGERRARYASAGGLFPVQVYLYTKPERVVDLPPGVFHYQAAQHRLVQVAPDLRIGGESYEPIVNAPMFAKAAFALFLICQPGRVEAKYGKQAGAYCLLEAGGMAQILRDRAARLGLGLCAIGEFPFERWRALFGVGPDEQYLYSLLGGIDPGPVPEPTLDEIMKSFKVG